MNDFKNVTPDELDELLHDEDKDEVLIDVRTPAEYESGHIKEAENKPLANIKNASEYLKEIGTVYVNCGSGMRSKQACEILASEGVNVVNIKGGLTAWMKDGFGVEGGGRKAIPIMRQVLIVAGTLVLVGMVLGYWYSEYLYLLSAFVGAGLLFAGVSGICTMSNILSKMPWNK